MLGIAVFSIVGIKGTQFLRDRRERCLEIADRESRVASEYRSGNSLAALRMAEWHDLQRNAFLRAAEQPWLPIPRILSTPAEFQPERILDYKPLIPGRSPTPR
jgi:hypothetical protein